MADDGSGVPVDGAGAAAGPTGPGWVIQLKGYHFHNTNLGLRFTNNEGKEFVENTFLKSLEEGSVQLPDGPNGAMIEVPIAKLGVQCPVVTTENPIVDVNYYPDAVGGETGSQMMGRMSDPTLGADGQPVGPKIWKLRRYDFTVQFYWKPTPRSARQAKPAAAAGSEPIDTVSVGDSTGPTG